MEKNIKILLSQRKVLRFDEIKNLFNCDEKETKEIITELIEKGYLIKGKDFESNEEVYLPIDINDEELNMIRVIEIKGKLHIVAIWKTKEGWINTNIYLGSMDEIFKKQRNLLNIFDFLNKKNKIKFETYK